MCFFSKMKDEINDYKYKISIKNKLLTDKNNDIIALKKKIRKLCNVRK